MRDANSHTFIVSFLLAVATLPASPAWAQRPYPGAPARPHATLRPFQSDAELLSYFQAIAQEHARERQRQAAARCGRDLPPPRTRRLPATGPASAVIRGRVTDEHGEPAVGAQVSIAALGIGTTSTASGSYRLLIPAESLASARRLTVHARKVGYESAARSLGLRQRDSVELDIRVCGSVVEVAAVTIAGFAADAAQKQEQITNTQHAGVDEGGIVKLHGAHLVILRRGRLFTVAVGDRDLEPIAAVDAFGPDVDPQSTWYDELLVSDDRVVVIGYSYQRGGTEIGVFRIDDRGRLGYVATYQLRSNDYYSSRNYASRLIGSTLVFYAPLYLWGNLGDPFTAFPAMRRWRDGTGDSAFRRIAPAPRVYRTAQPVSGFDIALHTVTTCDLAAADLACEATVIVGPSGRVFYVSPRAVYVWASSWDRRRRDEGERAVLYRMPLDGSAPSALGVRGSPVDQFSFLESDDGYLNVLVRSRAAGDAMWLPEVSAGDAALLRVPVRDFGDGSDEVPNRRYRPLPTPTGQAFHNRFVGDHLLYGVGSGWGRPRGDSTDLYVVSWRTRATGQVTWLALPHGVDRIEVMGSDAVVVGADRENLHFTGVGLAGTPQVTRRYTMPGASQGELRSHGFFYRGDGADSGVLGLPVREPGKPGYRHLFDASAGIVYLRNSPRGFASLGVLRARDENATNDRCRASCVDWYGNARPLFLRGRIFALLGYELVEGVIEANEIREVGRVSYAPGPKVTAR
jgi:hypothetical protein